MRHHNSIVRPSHPFWTFIWAHIYGVWEGQGEHAFRFARAQLRMRRRFYRVCVVFYACLVNMCRMRASAACVAFCNLSTRNPFAIIFPVYAVLSWLDRHEMIHCTQIEYTILLSLGEGQIWRSPSQAIQMHNSNSSTKHQSVGSSSSSQK